MDAGIPVLTSRQVFESKGILFSIRRKVVTPGKGYTLGNFKLIFFELSHDIYCLGCHVFHPSSGNILFITDTYMVENVFKNINHVMIEINYADDILIGNIIKGVLPALIKHRLMNSHMELESAKLFLKSIYNKELRNILLLHLSNGNSSEERFVREITEELGVNVMAADKEMIINFDKIPY